MKRSAQPLPSGARTKAGELAMPRNSSSFWNASAMYCWGGRAAGIRSAKMGRMTKPEKGPPMSYKRISIDTSKHVFTIHAVDEAERPVLRCEFRRSQIEGFFAKLAPTEVALEACAGAHHWGRRLSAMGQRVKLILPQYVKPFVKRNKNDRIYAEAIGEASVAAEHADGAGEEPQRTGSDHDCEAAGTASRTAHCSDQRATRACVGVRRDRLRRGSRMSKLCWRYWQRNRRYPQSRK
jgi:hypothetical protein